MPDIQTPEKIHDLPVAVIKNILALTTSGFGLVVALAWNDLVRKIVETYIDPYLGKNSGVVSLLIYSIVITLIAIIVTMQLTRLQRTLENIEARKKKLPVSKR